MLKTEFPRAYLAATAYFMADQDVRYYLKGVYVEALAAMRHQVANETPFDVIVPTDTVDLVTKMKLDFVDVARDDAGVWRLAGVPFVPVDGRFPDYRRVFPTTCSGVAGHYAPDLGRAAACDILNRARKAGML